MIQESRSWCIITPAFIGMKRVQLYYNSFVAVVQNLIYTKLKKWQMKNTRSLINSGIATYAYIPVHIRFVPFCTKDTYCWLLSCFWCPLSLFLVTHYHPSVLLILLLVQPPYVKRYTVFDNWFRIVIHVNLNIILYCTVRHVIDRVEFLLSR